MRFSSAFFCFLLGVLTFFCGIKPVYASPFCSRQDSVTIINPQKSYAARAAIMSAILPGLGQAYNKKLWKVPVIYTAFTGCGYLFLTNHNSYLKYKNALSLRYDEDANTTDNLPFYSDANLVELKRQYKRSRDLGLIGIIGIYLLNIVDASVDGHLRDFDLKMNEDIALKIRPDVDVVRANDQSRLLYSGIKIKFEFK